MMPLQYQYQHQLYFWIIKEELKYIAITIIGIFATLVTDKAIPAN
jgi:hypothetical protein